MHPAQDKTIDVNLFHAQDGLDPRCCGGPCQQRHLRPAKPHGEDLPALEFREWSGNRYARWVDCRRCGLRLGTWPKLGYTGEKRAQVDPRWVLRAFEEAAKDNIKDANMEGPLMKVYIEKARAEYKIQSKIAQGPRRAPKGQGKASTENDLRKEPEFQRPPMASGYSERTRDPAGAASSSMTMAEAVQIHAKGGHLPTAMLNKIEAMEAMFSSTPSGSSGLPRASSRPQSLGPSGTVRASPRQRSSRNPTPNPPLVPRSRQTEVFTISSEGEGLLDGVVLISDTEPIVTDTEHLL